MSLILKKTFSQDILIALWEISEKENFLYSLIEKNLSNIEKKTFFEIKNPSRKCEWLAVRCLLQEILLNYSPIFYSETGKPNLNDYFISISHSKNIVGVILHKKNIVGIDIQVETERILNVAPKFLSQKEISFATENQKISIFTIFWCAKETIFKIFEKGNVNFINDIEILPFEMAEEGTLNVIFHKTNQIFELQYFSFKNFKIVFGIL